jgi:hypothetical protein
MFTKRRNKMAKGKMGRPTQKSSPLGNLTQKNPKVKDISKNPNWTKSFMPQDLSPYTKKNPNK